MTSILGAARPRSARVAAAAALGMAMQRTNILRDIDEDVATAGVLLRRGDARRASARSLPGRRERCSRDQIAPRRRALRRGHRGHRRAAPRAPGDRRGGRMYREILRQLEREGYGARPGRAVVPPRGASCRRRARAARGARRERGAPSRAAGRPARRGPRARRARGSPPPRSAPAALAGAQVAYGRSPTARPRRDAGHRRAHAGRPRLAERAPRRAPVVAAAGAVGFGGRARRASPPAGRSGTTLLGAARARGCGGVPLLAAAAWAMMARPAWAVAGRSARRGGVRRAARRGRADGVGRLPRPADGARGLLVVAAAAVATRACRRRTSRAGS